MYKILHPYKISENTTPSDLRTMAVPNIKLNSGYEMPQVGFGLWKVREPRNAGETGLECQV